MKTESSPQENDADEESSNFSKLTTSKLAAKHKLKTNDLLEKLVNKGFLTINDNGKNYLTDLGKSVGGEFRSSQYGGYFLWNENTEL